MAGWISINDKLPPRDTLVLFNVHYENGIDFVTAGEAITQKDGTISFYTEDYDPCGGDEYRITHWMLFPEPPNKK